MCPLRSKKVVKKWHFEHFLTFQMASVSYKSPVWAENELWGIFYMYFIILDEMKAILSILIGTWPSSEPMGKPFWGFPTRPRMKIWPFEERFYTNKCLFLQSKNKTQCKHPKCMFWWKKWHGLTFPVNFFQKIGMVTWFVGLSSQP